MGPAGAAVCGAGDEAGREVSGSLHDADDLEAGGSEARAASYPLRGLQGLWCKKCAQLLVWWLAMCFDKRAMHS